MRSKARGTAWMMTALLALCCLLLSGCIRQQPVFAGAPTPRPTPTPPPAAVTQAVSAQPWPQDALGAYIYDNAHFLRYLVFTNIRVFEYEGGTMMEGTCTNAYPEPLAAKYEIVFRKGDTVMARAAVHNRGEDGVFPPGEVKVYASIDTDTSLMLTPFTLEAKEGPSPASASSLTVSSLTPSSLTPSSLPTPSP